MMQYEGSEVIFLERLSFGGLTLDPTLQRGEWRPLSTEEIEALRKAPVQVESKSVTQ